MLGPNSKGVNGNVNNRIS